ncbi:cag pathogenicity island protein Cag25 [Pseudoalteromonas sp. S3178]|uniref:EF-hand domain-containing protein n=1 Tax=Pseudoalteromonas sp. S3178 TaxID=579532 RepID=UPI00110A5DC9|nr:EF-hand domain-containing protein [Pseudoalteromonas sp. S3178]TMP03128.1 cag pathogenicity island protein Cag25 [Pseudoalteromonas sp. S3178]
MNNRLLVISSLAALGFLSASALAMDVQATFNELDKDSNGTLSEAEAGEDAVLHENFSQIDTNQDGQLSLNEFKKFIQ